MYNRQGKHEEAMRYLQHALQIQRKAFGDVHPDVATSKYQHLLCPRSIQQGRLPPWARALPCLQRLLGGARALSPSHQGIAVLDMENASQKEDAHRRDDRV